MKLVFLGPPGAGKGTQAANIASTLRVPHISTGDMFRAAIKNETPTGLRAKAFIDKGELVPDEVTIQLVRERVAQADCAAGFLLDGFPRTVAQAEALDTFQSLDAVVDIFVADEALVSRLSGRRVCPDCGATYHVDTLAGVTDCAACGVALIQRRDDMPETILNRLSVYHAQTKPLAEFYRAAGLLREVNGSQPIADVGKDILAVLGA